MKQIYELYLPSFFTRYLIQFLIVGLPWMLQARKFELTEIAMLLGCYYATSLLVSLANTKIIHFLPSRNTIIVAGLFQAVLCTVILLSSGLATIYISMVFLGVSVGLLRPMSKIWLLENQTELIRRNEIIKRSAWSEIFVSLGMALGGALGAVAGKINNILNLAIVSGCIMLPTVLLLTLKKTDNNICNKPSESNEFLSDKFVWAAILIYLLSVCIFKLWIVKVPFELRKAGDIVTQSELAFILAIHPIGFLVGQFLMGRFAHLLTKNQDKLMIALSSLTVMQGALTWAAIYVKSKLLVGILVVGGGGVLAAGIFPIAIALVESHLVNGGAKFKRQVMVLFSIAADVGQVIAMLILSSLVPEDIRSISIHIPILLVIAVTLIMLIRAPPAVSATNEA